VRAGTVRASAVLADLITLCTHKHRSAGKREGVRLKVSAADTIFVVTGKYYTMLCKPG
jgi:hypothetical protein